jgi:hypothetical protein
MSQAKACGYRFFNRLILQLVAAPFRVRFFWHHDFFNNLYGVDKIRRQVA